MKSFKILGSVLLVALLLSGCSSRNNLTDISVVEGVGIDLKDNEITATIQSLNLIKEGNGAEALSGNVTLNSEGSGKTISEAIEDVSKITSKELFFGQNRIVVFGMDLAENYLDKSLDYLLRSSDSRSDVTIAVAKQEAAKIMESPENDALVPAQTISALLCLSEKSGFGAHVTTNDLLNAYADKTSDIYLPVLEVKDKNVSVAGIAVYDKSKMTHILNEEESYGFLFLRNKVEQGLLQIEDEKLGKVGTDIVSAKAKSKADFEGENVRFEVKIKLSLMLDEVEHGIINELSREELKTIERLAERKIEMLCRKGFDACVQNQSDALRIGEYLAMYNPEAYSELSNNWKNNLQTAQLEIDVKCKLNKINENAEGN